MAKRARSVGKGSEPTSKVPRAAIGNGGEIHQVGGGDVPILTTQQGIPVSDDQNSLRVGARGPAALEDFAFREKIFHFDHERIPERVVHARGFGAHGYFENYESLADITRADVFARAGKKTPAFVRFSTVAGVPVRRVGRLVLDRCVENFFAETEQVAFCTQNIVPGVDFSNDPLLQGRNFSYLDTQLKRLGSPNFTFLPINAPKCPFHTMQQDGHMAMVNPKGRVNYEPNSWAGALGGPREAPDKGFRSFSVAERGSKDRVRSETFADHYSQARQFYISQTDVEQAHIASAFTFELSKVQTVAIRSRMVGHLLNIEEGLAHTVAGGLRLREMPRPAEAARPTRSDLKKSPALSILLNGPESFEGRKVGALVSDGVDGELLEALRGALAEEGAQLKVIAPMVGGVEAADGTWIDADEKIDGGPSVVFDAVALLVSDAGAEFLVNESTVRDFVADAFAHLKFIAYVDAALPLMRKAGIDEGDIDEGCVEISSPETAASFVKICRKLRYWDRAAAVKQV